MGEAKSFLDELLGDSDSDDDLLGALPDTILSGITEGENGLASISEDYNSDDQQPERITARKSLNFTPGRRRKSSRRAASTSITRSSTTRNNKDARRASIDLEKMLSEEEPLEEKSTEEYMEIRSDVSWEPIGIVNLGNTCYFNSLTQSLFSCEHFCHTIWESLETS